MQKQQPDHLKDYTNKELEGISPTRIGMMLKALKSQSSGIKLHFCSIILIEFFIDLNLDTSNLLF